MKFTLIKNISPQTVGIFARINGADGRINISPGQEVVADNFETRIMKIYKKKGLITITPVNVAQLMESEASKLLSEQTTPTSTVEEIVNSNNNEVLDKPHTIDNIKTVTPAPLLSPELISIAPNDGPIIIDSADNSKTLQEIQDEVEQYVEDGYIKGAWSEEDISFLRKYYPTKGRKYCSNSLNRNESSVQKKINSLGIKKKKKKK